MTKDLELTPNLKKSYDEDGFVVIRGFLDANEVAEVKLNLNRYISEIVPTLPATDAFYEDIEQKETLKQLFRMQTHDSYFDQEIAGGRFSRLADELLGEGANHQGIMYFNKSPGIGLPTPPHQDGYYWKIIPCNGLTMWLALEKVDEENGCLHYSKGSQSLGLREHRQTNTLGFSQGIVDFPNDDDRTGDTSIFAEAGDLLVHQAKTVHWASGNDSITRTRQSMGLVYYAPEVEIDKSSQDAYSKSLHDDLEKAGKI